MAPDPGGLLEEALKLSLECLDDAVDEDAEAAWTEEIDKRIRDLDSEAATAVPWSEARRRILGR